MKSFPELIGSANPEAHDYEPVPSARISPAVFRPWLSLAVTDKVIVLGVERHDYRVECDEAGQKIIFDSLSYEEACNFQIVKTVQHKTRFT